MANNKVLKRRVVVTGLGAITPIGNSVAEFWDGIRKGKVGIGEITKFDTTDYKVKLAAEVKDFVPGDHMDKKQPDVWKHFLNMRLQQPEKLMKILDWRLKKRPISRWRDDWFRNWKSSGSRAEL